MFTCEEAPWIEYLEIDEETGERVLRIDTPEEIREQYNKYILEKQKKSNGMQPK